MVAIGVFDGVHRGHQRILSQALDAARGSESMATVVSFDPHPEAVLHPTAGPRVLTPLRRKIELLGSMGLDELIVIEFDLPFAGLSPEEFCLRVLSTRLRARAVLVGANFRFGRGGTGSVEDLRRHGAEHGFDVSAVPLESHRGETISSTRIRVLLDEGKVAEAAALLGRPHRLEGDVVGGAGRGRTLRAPTANLAPAKEAAIPGQGVYVTRARTAGGAMFPAVTSVGTNPTFEQDDEIRIETLILDFDGDLYGSWLGVDFLERLRDQEVFPDATTLAERIREDVEAARRYLGSESAAAPLQ